MSLIDPMQLQKWLALLAFIIPLAACSQEEGAASPGDEAAAAHDLRSPLAGIRAGHVFIDVEGAPHRRLEVTARAEGRSARMGDILALPSGVDRVTVVAGEAGSYQVEVIGLTTGKGQVTTSMEASTVPGTTVVTSDVTVRLRASGPQE